MPGGNKNIRPEDNTNGLQHNPQNINRNGRPRKMVSQVIKELKEAGIERVSASDVYETIEIFLNLTTVELGEYANNSNCSILVRTIARKLAGQSDKDRAEYIETLLNRAHGRSIKGDEMQVNVMPQITVFSDETADILKKMYKIEGDGTESK